MSDAVGGLLILAIMRLQLSIIVVISFMFVSHDGGARWERISANEALPTIWSLTVDPVDPDILFAGTRPAGV